jgi:hypothetical protein
MPPQETFAVGVGLAQLGGKPTFAGTCSGDKVAQKPAIPASREGDDGTAFLLENGRLRNGDTDRKATKECMFDGKAGPARIRFTYGPLEPEAAQSCL